MKTNKSITEFASEHGITLSAVRVDSNPNMTDSQNMDHWRVTMRMGRRQMTIPYSMGYGHGGRSPEVQEVLYCLAMDANGFSAPTVPTFEEWADDYGYDHDSRKAEGTYKACKRQSDKLKAFLGIELLVELVDCEEE